MSVSRSIMHRPSNRLEKPAQKRISHRSSPMESAPMACKKCLLIKWIQTTNSNKLAWHSRFTTLKLIEARMVTLISTENADTKITTSASLIVRNNSQASPWRLQISTVWSKFERKSPRWSTTTNWFTVQIKRDKFIASRCRLGSMRPVCLLESLMASSCYTLAVSSFHTRPSGLSWQVWTLTTSLRKTSSFSRTWLTWISPIIESKCINLWTWSRSKS